MKLNIDWAGPLTGPAKKTSTQEALRSYEWWHATPERSLRWTVKNTNEILEDLRKAGRPAWDAVVEATEHRMRPIMLTAAAASLALIPIAREIFWGPMAYVMMGGIIMGTMLTLLFLPALYVAWFRIKEPAPAADFSHENPTAPELQANLSGDAPSQPELEHA